ncbi:MAG: hypothetical protein ABEJ07_03910 [Candidatus Nanohaloarchaea archaeon]
MMVSTHILIGGLIGYLFSTAISVNPVTLALAGMLGGLIPELDFLIGHHRKTLHFPYSYFLLSIPVLILIPFFQAELLILLATVLVSAGVHSFMDIFAGAELRSWDESEWEDTAVYDHIRDKWIQPQRIAYGGSMRDFLLSTICFFSTIYLINDPKILLIATGLIVFSVAYTMGIKKASDEIIDGKYATLNGFIRSKLKALL